MFCLMYVFKRNKLSADMQSYQSTSLHGTMPCIFLRRHQTRKNLPRSLQFKQQVIVYITNMQILSKCNILKKLNTRHFLSGGHYIGVPISKANWKPTISRFTNNLTSSLCSVDSSGSFFATNFVNFPSLASLASFACLALAWSFSFDNFAFTSYKERHAHAGTVDIHAILWFVLKFILC